MTLIQVIDRTDPRMGRHIRHDPRSKAFPFRGAGAVLHDVEHVRHIPILNQGDLGSCHDSDTEVLTRSGWLPFADLNLDNELATVDPATGVLTYERPTRVIAMPYRGDVHSVRRQGMNFRVTPDHVMMVRKWDEARRKLADSYSFVPMKNIGWYSGLMTSVIHHGTPNDGTYTIPGIPGYKRASQRTDIQVPMHSWLGFLGIYLAEGTMIKPVPKCQNKIQLAAVKDREKSFIRGVLADLGVHALELKDRFTFENARVYRHLESLGLKGIHAPEKFVPDFVFGLPAGDIRAFLTGHREGDGSVQDGVWTHYTSSPRLADDLQRLIFLSGGKTGRSMRAPRSAVMSDGRTVTARHPEYGVRHLVGVKSSIERKTDVTIEPYEGMVYCAEVPTHHTLVTRREGVILIAGNCTGNAAVGALGTGILWDAIMKTLPAAAGHLDEVEARALYSAATKLDDYSGSWPPTDTGSDGLSIAKACLAGGLISGYQHAFTFDDFLAALQVQPVIVGTLWYQSMFSPYTSGVVPVVSTSGVAGGHEYVARRFDADSGLIGFDNSWGTSWGQAGSFFVRASDFRTLLADNGDATVFTPLTAPAPVPDPPVDPGGPFDAVIAALRRAWPAFDAWCTRHGIP